MNVSDKDHYILLTRNVQSYLPEMHETYDLKVPHSYLYYLKETPLFPQRCLLLSCSRLLFVCLPRSACWFSVLVSLMWPKTAIVDAER